VLTADQEDVARRVAGLAARIADRPGLEPDAPLAGVGLDSIGYAELALAVEEEFGVRLGDADALRLRTPREVALAMGGLNGHGPAARIPGGIGRHQSRVKGIAGPLLSRY
jgi:acyl carrier protein